MTKQFVNDVSYEVIGSIIEVHKHLGPGLIESTYHKCLAYEFSLRHLNFISEGTFPFHYKDLDLSTDFRCDLLVEGVIMLELKAVMEIVPFFKAKLLNQMKIAKVPKGMLVNFNVNNIMNEGHHVFLNEFYTKLL
jgi:GxxExxY protein